MLTLPNVPADAILIALGIIALVVLFVPVVLRLAGLTGQQISDVIGLTLQFFINLVKEFRAQNNQQ